MKGFLTWAVQKLNAAAEATVNLTKKTSYFLMEGAQYLVDGVEVILTYPYLQAYVNNMLRQTKAYWQNIFNTKPISVICDSKTTQAVLYSSTVAGTSMLIFAMMRKIMNEVSDPDERGFCEDLVYDLLCFYIARLGGHQMIDRVARAIAITHDVAKDKSLKSNFPASRCKTVSIVKGNLDLLIDLLAKRLFVLIALRYLWSPFAFYFHALEEGENLLSYKYDSLDVCTKHQYEIFSANKTYVFWLGSTLILTADGLAYLLSDKIDDFYGPIYNLVYPFFILTTLCISQPLLNEKGGFDVFEWSRLLLKTSIKASLKYAAKVMNMFVTDKSDNHVLGLIQHATSYVYASIPECVKLIFLDRDLHSFTAASNETPLINIDAERC